MSNEHAADPGHMQNPAIYGHYQAHVDAQNDFHLRMQHKAADIPPMPGDVNVKNGLGVREILALGAIAVPGIGVAALGGALLWDMFGPGDAVTPPAVEPPPAVDTDADTHGTIRFVDPR